jgi:pantetheine-phosphate adenylyltransferase
MENNMSKKRAIYSGTFDPITNGHIDIIKRALNVFDEVIVAVALSSSKKPMFNSNDRTNLAKIATSDLKGVIVIPFDNLLVDFAKEQKVTNIIRGLRAVSDFEYELQMGYANSSLDKNLETIYFMPTLKNAFVSSSVVRELIKFKGKFNHLVPKNTLKDIKNVYSN